MADAPSSRLSLRAARADDALCLGVLATQVFLDTYCSGGIRPTVAREVLSSCSTKAFEQALAEPSTRLCLAEADGHLVGFAQLALDCAHEHVWSGPAAELQRLYVQEPFTGKQLGTALLRRAEELATLGGAKVLWLTVWTLNQRARAFYARRGFTDLGSAWFRFEGESHENRCLGKSLKL